MAKTSEVILAEIQKDVKYIVERLDRIDRMQDMASRERAEMLRTVNFDVFLNSDFKPLEQRVDGLERWQLKIVAYASIAGAVVSLLGTFIIEKVLSSF